MYHLYILKCADKTFYTGIAKNLGKRIGEHNAGNRGAKYTRSRRPARLVYQRAFRNRSNAQKAEAKIKAMSRAEKMLLVADG